MTYCYLISTVCFSEAYRVGRGWSSEEKGDSRQSEGGSEGRRCGAWPLVGV